MNSMETRAGGQTAADQSNDILDLNDEATRLLEMGPEPELGPESELEPETGLEPAAEPEAEPQPEPQPQPEAGPKPATTKPGATRGSDEVTIVLERGETGSTTEGSSPEMQALAMEEWDYQRPRRGEIRDGVIIAIHDLEIIVDVGAKREGIVPFADMQRLGPEGLAELSPGDEVPVYIMRPEDQDGNLLVSLYMARQSKAWDVAQRMYEDGEVWEAEVTGYNKGGVVIPVLDIRGFVPASQVPGFPAGSTQEERLQRLAEVVGQKLRVKIIEINQRKRRLILSATTAEKQWRKQQREQLLDDLREGEVRRGRVTSLASFGAFVDLGGADGLIHISELAWRRVRHPKEVVKVGDEVEVYILRLDHEHNRIGLSLKRLQPEPWALVEDRYELGQLVEGVVTNVIDFGAFAEIEEGIEGLIHVSELADAAVSHPRDVVKKGDLLLLRIIRIDVRRKRLGLSLKRVLESEWAAWAAKLAADKDEERKHRAARPTVADVESEPEPPVSAVPEEEQAEPAVAEELAAPEEEQDEPVVAEEPAVPEEEQDEPAVAEELAVPEEEQDEPVVAQEPAVPEEEQDEPAVAQEPAAPQDGEAPADAEELATIES